MTNKPIRKKSREGVEALGSVLSRIYRKIDDEEMPEEIRQLLDRLRSAEAPAD